VRLVTAPCITGAAETVLVRLNVADINYVGITYDNTRFVFLFTDCAENAEESPA
jgi:hypothetical protein